MDCCVRGAGVLSQDELESAANHGAHVLWPSKVQDLSSVQELELTQQVNLLLVEQDHDASYENALEPKSVRDIRLHHLRAAMPEHTH